jgi:hypothetical protein
MGKESTTNRNTLSMDDNATPPIYYDSEPSSQPPRYPNTQGTAPQSISATKPQTTTISPSKPANQYRTGADASTVAAVLASPYEDLDAQRRADRKKKTISERWRDFKERNFGEYDQGRDRAGSAAEWNVQGGRLNGGLSTPYRRK